MGVLLICLWLWDSGGHSWAVLAQVSHGDAVKYTQGCTICSCQTRAERCTSKEPHSCGFKWIWLLVSSSSSGSFHRTTWGYSQAGGWLPSGQGVEENKTEVTVPFMTQPWKSHCHFLHILLATRVSPDSVWETTLGLHYWETWTMQNIEGSFELFCLQDAMNSHHYMYCIILVMANWDMSGFFLCSARLLLHCL